MVSEMSATTVLIVDDEPHVVELLASRMSNEGWIIHTAWSGEEAVRILQKEPIEILASDFSMPNMTGAELVNHALALKPEIYSIIFTGYGDRDFAVRALEAGVSAFIDKTADTEDNLRAAIKRGIQIITLTRFGRKLLEIDEEESVLDLMVESLARIKEFDGCCLAVREGRETYRVERAVDFKTGNELEHERIEEKDSAYRYVIRERTPYLPPLLAPEGPVLRPFVAGSKSIAVVPLTLKGGEKGALGIEHREENRLTIEDLRFLNQVAYWVTLAMEKLTQQERALLERERSKERGDLLARAAFHDIKNPLMILVLAVQSAAERLPDDIRQSLLENIGRINSAVNKILRPAIRGEKSRPEDVDVAEVIREATSNFRLTHPEDHVQFIENVSPALPTIVGHRAMLVSAMLNLLENGATATARTGRPAEMRLSANYVIARDQVEIVVKDNGRGIPAALIDRVFDYGMTTDEENGHTGYGLAFTRDMVTLNGGGISVSSIEGEGTTFKLAFPVGATLAEQQNSSRDEGRGIEQA
jgi:signal transduction histidine kinase/ActR/RegA family two-component response regulator